MGSKSFSAWKIISEPLAVRSGTPMNVHTERIEIELRFFLNQGKSGFRKYALQAGNIQEGDN